MADDGESGPGREDARPGHESVEDGAGEARSERGAGSGTGGVGSTTLVEIDGIAAGGEGVGRLPSGKVVFVHRTAPGERVELRLLEEKKSWARAEPVRIERASSARREAPCPHYDRCGGCTLEHLEYGAQLEAKAGIVVDALERIGGRTVETPEVVASPEEFRYRNRVSFALLRLGGGRIVAGFHELNRPKQVLDITAACMLPEPALGRAWGALREAWGQGAHRLPSGRRLRLTLRSTAAGEVTLLVDGGYGRGRPEALIEEVPGLVAVWHRPKKRSGIRLLAGEGSVDETWGGETLALRGDVFLQVNRGAAEALEAYVLELSAGASRERRGEPEGERGGDHGVEREGGKGTERADDLEGLRVVDAYCGVGLYARRLAAAGATTVGIERDERAVEEARRDAPAGAAFVVGDVEDRLPETLPADAVVLNPPRTGLDDAVTEALAEARPERTIYVSCDPATLARDVDRLGSEFRIASVRCFDLFPQTAHVETVVEMRCGTS
ncbi:MAG: class I SAM-dependent RNA methyltransferase [Gemmatimonadota bacterium]